jgi:CheY-like chemotaxis protein
MEISAAGSSSKSAAPDLVRGAPGAADQAALVLHVEDDAAVRASVQMLMRSAGLRVVSVASGTEALQRVQSERLQPDVLIVDFHLADDMTGTDVAEALARKIGHAPPTIVLTGDKANAELPWLVNAPVWMVSKPFDPAVLLAGVESLASFHRRTHARDA